eukprot:7837560-Prorocentrum_lima.AAC.1
MLSVRRDLPKPAPATPQLDELLARQRPQQTPSEGSVHEADGAQDTHSVEPSLPQQETGGSNEPAARELILGFG